MKKIISKKSRKLATATASGNKKLRELRSVPSLGIKKSKSHKETILDVLSWSSKGKTFSEIAQSTKLSEPAVRATISLLRKEGHQIAYQKTTGERRKYYLAKTDYEFFMFLKSEDLLPKKINWR